MHEHFAAGSEPTAPCDWHRFDNGRIVVDWPAEVRTWAAQRRRAGGQSEEL